MFDFSINQRSKGAISSVSALFRIVEALERLRCFKGSLDFHAEVQGALRGWLGVTPCHLWLDSEEEVCIIFSTKCSSQWEEQRLYVNRNGELSSPYLSEDELDELKYGLDQLFKD